MRSWQADAKQARKRALGAGGRRAWQRERGERQQARGVRDSRQGVHGLGARAGQGYALGALSLFLARFDSVLFLSQFLDIFREIGS